MHSFAACSKTNANTNPNRHCKTIRPVQKFQSCFSITNLRHLGPPMDGPK